MNKVVLYIKDADNVFQTVDLFEDETISVTSKIQDIRDISKVFTDFSQSFTLPASKKNNKVFKHFYNYFISDGAFDARKRVEARIEVNYIPFREGKILLNGVKMKENKPYSYNVTFFGNTVTLKDLLGDDKLSSLTWLDTFSYEYNNAETKNRFQNLVNVFTSGGEQLITPIIVPLITPEKRLFFDSTNNTSDTLSGNIHYQSGGGTHHRGISFDDLKPALKVYYIIRAIEEKYIKADGYPIDLKFTDDFFGNSAAFFGNNNITDKGLYMWLSREKGKLGGDEITEYVLENFVHSSGDTLADFETKTITPSIEDSGTDEDSVFRIEEWFTGSGTSTTRYVVDFEITIQQTAGNLYDFKVINTEDNNSVVAEFNAQSGTQTFSFRSNLQPSFGGSISGIKMILTSEANFVGTASDLRVRQVADIAKGTDITIATAYYSTTATIGAVSTIRPTERMPEIKIYDFLTGIFKMFNLTAYFVDDFNDADYGKLKVLPLDDYYNDNPKIFDITKYVDSKETDIDATIPYSEIEFKYKDPKTLLMLQHKEKFNDVFGDSEFKEQDIDRGKPYKIELPFEHLKFERLFDDADQTDKTDILWGYSAGDNFKPDANASPKTGNYDSVLTEPILFYGIRITGLSTDKRISWLDNGTHSAISNYWRPSNTVENGTDLVAPSFTINFDNEVDEWNLQDYSGETNSLFKKFYETYITDAFDAKKRIFKLTAHLPNSILLNYKLNDRFQIGDKVFTINSIDTNLKTGESKLELLNVL